MATLEGKHPLTTAPGLDVHLYGVASPYAAGSGIKVLGSEFLALYDAVTATLTNKSIDASSNTITNITNTAISASAAIQLSKLASLTFDRALISGPTGIISVSATTAAELGFLSGVTSNVQTQLDGKGVGDILDGGNATGSPIVIGTNDAQDVVFEVAGSPVARFPWTSAFGLIVSTSVTSSTAKLYLGENTFSTILPLMTMQNAFGVLDVRIFDQDPNGFFLGDIGDVGVDVTNGLAYIKRTNGAPTGWQVFGDVLIGGNSPGSTMSIGTNDPNGLNLRTSLVDRVFIDTSGNVGIGGASSPAAIFHIDTNDVSSTPIARFQNTIGSYEIYFGAGSPEGVLDGFIGYTYIDGGTGLHYVKGLAGGNTGWLEGVNTTSTQTLLNKTLAGATNSITGDIDANARVDVKLNDVSTSTRRGINFIEGSGVSITVVDDSINEEADVTIAATGGTGDINDGGNSTGSTIVIGTNDSNDLQFETNNTTRMHLDVLTGDIGIGTVTPTARLQVDSQGANTAPIIRQTNTVGSFDTFNGTGSPESVVSAIFGSEYTDLNTGDKYIKKTATGNTGWVLDFATNSDVILEGGNSFASSLEIGTNDAFSVFISANGSAAIEVDTSQQVGIGNSPSSAFHVDSNAASTTAIITVENTAGDFQIFTGSGSPETVVTASIGDKYTDITNGVFYIKETGTATTTGWASVTTSGSGSQIAMYTNTDTATELNNATDTTVPIMGTQVFLDSDFSVNGNGIQCDFDGVVEVSGNLYYDGNSTNGGLHMQFADNGTVFGPVAAHGYLRNTNGHTNSSLVLSGVFRSVSNGDTITMIARRGTNDVSSNTMTVSGNSFLSLKRIR